MLRSMQVVRHTSQAPWSALHTRSLVGSTVTRSSADGDSHREVEPPNVQKLAQLASIGVTDEEAAEWGPKIGSIVEWFGQLQQVDLDGVPPALRAEIGDGNLLREDVPEEFAARYVKRLCWIC